MFEVTCLVIEIKDNFYDVFINDGDNLVLYQIYDADTERGALRKALGYECGDCDLNIRLRDKCGVFCIYDVEDVDDVDDVDDIDDFGFVFGSYCD